MSSEKLEGTELTIVNLPKYVTVIERERSETTQIVIMFTLAGEFGINAVLYYAFTPGIKRNDHSIRETVNGILRNGHQSILAYMKMYLLTFDVDAREKMIAGYQDVMKKRLKELQAGRSQKVQKLQQ